MKFRYVAILSAVSMAFVSGCSTTNSIPYKASTANVISIQQSLKSSGKKVNMGNVTAAAGVNQEPTCRLMGPVNVAPGRTLTEYIGDAFQEELFMAGVYAPNAPTTINARINSLDFSSIAPANWKISMSVSSNKSSGYTVAIEYPFSTSFDAYSACKNVANAFGPAVQELLEQVVNHPDFRSLVI